MKILGKVHFMLDEGKIMFSAMLSTSWVEATSKIRNLQTES